MSATAAVAHGRYKDQLKLMRAETVTAWMTAALGWMIEPVREQPAESILDEEKAARKRWYGAFY